MMKHFIIIALLVMAVTCLSAQSRWAFGLDIEGGVSGQRDWEEDLLSFQPSGSFYFSRALERRPGMSIGAWTEVLLSHRFGLRLGVNYARLGGFAERHEISYGTSDNVTGFSRVRNDNVQRQIRIPLETKIYFGPAGWKSRPFLSLGAQAAYALSHRTITNSYFVGLGGGEVFENAYANEVDMNNEFVDIRRWRISPITGLGVMGDRFTLSVQRSWGKQAADFLSGSLGYECYCNNFIDCFFPGPPDDGHGCLQLLQMTSLRFAYRLF